MIAVLDIGSLDGGPGDAVRGFFLPDVAGVRREGVIEGGAIDVLRMGRKVVADRCGKVGIGAVWHRCSPGDEGCLSEDLLDFFR